MTHFTHVLCPVDFSEISRLALHHAAAIARWYEARLTVLHVLVSQPAIDLPSQPLDEVVRDRLTAELRAFTAAVSPDVSLVVRIEEAPDAHGEIVAQASVLGADLLVLGTHGRSGFERAFLGSTTEKVIRLSHCPTLVVPPRAPDVAVDTPVSLRHVLCPIDFSEASLSAAAFAFQLAQESDANLTLLHVVEIPLGADFRGGPPALVAARHAAAHDARTRLHDLVSPEVANYCTVEVAIVEGRAYRKILEQAAARHASVVVMGVHSRGAVDRWVFGSTAHHVIRAAACPVLIVR